MIIILKPVQIRLVRLDLSCTFVKPYDHAVKTVSETTIGLNVFLA